MRSLGACWAASAGCFIVGCAAPKPPPAVAEGSYAGPPARLEAPSGQPASVVFSAPTPGWQPTLDQTRPGPRGLRVYVSLRQPSPLLIYPQVITENRVGLPASARPPIEVFARVLAHDEAADPGGPYRPLAPAPVQP